MLPEYPLHSSYCLEILPEPVSLSKGHEIADVNFSESVRGFAFGCHPETLRLDDAPLPGQSYCYTPPLLPDCPPAAWPTLIKASRAVALSIIAWRSCWMYHTNNARLLLINLMPSSKLLIPATLAIATGGGGGIVAAKLARADARLITPMVYRIEPVNIFPFSSACMPFSVSHVNRK